MALLCGPDLLIADEPTTALDVTVQAQVLDLLADLGRDTGIAIVLITHDLGVIARLADRVMVMYAGRAVETANAGDLFSDPRHPYSRGLLGAMPRPEDDGPLATIPGQPPNMQRPITGCAFAPRCPLAEAACRAALPQLVQLGPGRAAACIKVAT